MAKRGVSDRKHVIYISYVFMLFDEGPNYVFDRKKVTLLTEDRLFMENKTSIWHLIKLYFLNKEQPTFITENKILVWWKTRTQVTVQIFLSREINGRLTYGSRSRTKLWSFTDDQVLVIDQVMVVTVDRGPSHGRLWRTKFWSLTKLQ